mgnify:CR=1 FL=1
MEEQEEKPLHGPALPVTLLVLLSSVLGSGWNTLVEPRLKWQGYSQDHSLAKPSSRLAYTSKPKTSLTFISPSLLGLKV